VKGLPNIKSAKKRVKVAEAKTFQNVVKKSALKTAVKKCREAIKSDDASVATVLTATVKSIDKAAAKNLIHKNTAARKKSKLAKAMNAAKK
jgi:small subunit ribosomal protein S20